MSLDVASGAVAIRTGRGGPAPAGPHPRARSSKNWCPAPSLGLRQVMRGDADDPNGRWLSQCPYRHYSETAFLVRLLVSPQHPALARTATRHK
jgi:hypothetical protein